MRLFFGIELSDDARRTAAHYALAARRFWPGRYVEPANYHMTLCYIGEADERQARQIFSIGQETAVQFCFSPLRLGTFGHFGKRDKALLYLGAEGAEPYSHCACALRKLLLAHDLPHDPKPFYPHITLARNACLTDAGPEIKPSVLWTPSCITLFHSHRVDNVLTYTPIRRYPFCQSR